MTLPTPQHDSHHLLFVSSAPSHRSLRRSSSDNNTTTTSTHHGSVRGNNTAVAFFLVILALMLALASALALLRRYRSRCCCCCCFSTQEDQNREADDTPARGDIPPDTSIERRAKLVAWFTRENVSMVVLQKDLVSVFSSTNDGPEYCDFSSTATLPFGSAEGGGLAITAAPGVSSSKSNAKLADEDSKKVTAVDQSFDDNTTATDEEDDVSNSHLKLPSPAHVVPNCCAICLSPYLVDDSVVWSNNTLCRHAFHEECVIGWLTAKGMKGDRTPCPCCRQDFCKF